MLFYIHEGHCYPSYDLRKIRLFPRAKKQTKKKIGKQKANISDNYKIKSKPAPSKQTLFRTKSDWQQRLFSRPSQ